MKIGIIGAGFTGLTAAYRLIQKGHDVTVFEKDTQVGGLAIGYQEKNWEWTLEKHYHHWFTNDHHVLKLAKELSHPVFIRRPHTNWYVDGKIYGYDSIPAMLSFPPLSLVERIREMAVLGILRFDPWWKPLEKYNASKVLPTLMGEKAYKTLFEPLFLNKFGKYADEVSLAWFWARIVKRTPSLAYPEKGFLAFAEHLAEEVKKQKGTVLLGQNITEIRSEDKGIVESSGDGKKQSFKFDRIIVTLPGAALVKSAPSLPSKYAASLTQLKGLGATNLVLRLSKPFFHDKTYWLSIANTAAPIMAVVEHTNFMDPAYYGGEHIVYLGNYMESTDPRFALNDEETLKRYDSFLRTINPDYKKNLIGFKLFKAPFAQPIIPPNYSHMIPPFNTPMKHVYLANIQQVYPWDRGTNYAVELGEKISDYIAK